MATDVNGNNNADASGEGRSSFFLLHQQISVDTGSNMQRIF